MSTVVFRLSPDSLVSSAWRAMRARMVRHACIVDGTGALIGILSDRDVLSVSGATDQRVAKVSEVMTPTPVSRHVDATDAELAQLMLTLHIDAVPIIDEANRPVGIVTSSDLLRTIAKVA